uniref:Uncharacterized protein n=1 Tax=Chromera velia CCMP2878 TaxID=1169474 RepID=A0A0G4HSV6_9ALVE|eukprot:Cvel_8342.t1-p1 / transcript=Cvel_8342.t1 / gene=Cvel_8342 / organism=Chromera_velia_CCMP2878 / gene_product=hypothetical protein / transcript_product=hypothetical protein / location=Cvel_scaffold459:43273-44190(+) / protein_length=306 / sequence_SO=supercontig / SO=protein_coding / is_pseudo=false
MDPTQLLDAVAVVAGELTSQISGSSNFLGALASRQEDAIRGVFCPEHFKSLWEANVFKGNTNDIREILTSFTHCSLDNDAAVVGGAKLGKFSHGPFKGQPFQINATGQLSSGFVLGEDAKNSASWSPDQIQNAKEYCFSPAVGGVLGGIGGSFGGAFASWAVSDTYTRLQGGREALCQAERVTVTASRVIAPFLASMAGSHVGTALAGLHTIAMSGPVTFVSTTALAGAGAGIAAGAAVSTVSMATACFVRVAWEARSWVKTAQRVTERAEAAVSVLEGVGGSRRLSEELRQLSREVAVLSSVVDA